MKKIVLLILLTVFMAGFSAEADMLILNNGDRITGTLVAIEGGVARITTAYAGEISVKMDAVSAIETDEVRAVALSDETIVEGVLVREDERMGVRAADDFRPATSADIVALAATPEALDGMLNPPPPKKWSGTVDLGLALRSGNTDTTDFKFSVGVKRTGDRNTLALNFAAAYGAADDVLNTRRYQFDYRWQYYLQERLFLYNIGLAERDDGRKLDYRLQTGLGVGYDFIKQEKRTLSADLGATYTRERWNPFTPWERTALRDDIRSSALSDLYTTFLSIGNGAVFTPRSALEQLYDILLDLRDPLRDYQKRNEDYVNLRLGLNFSQQIFKSSTITEALVLMPNLEEFGEFRALSELALVTPLSEKLNLKTSLKTEYDSLAEERGVNAWDNTLMTQFTYKF